MAMSNFKQRTKEKVNEWMREGMSPSRLSVTLALGFSIGCLPITGLPTVLCLVLAILLRLNLPAIQAANFIAWPAQLILVLPMVRLGHWILLRFWGHELKMSFDSGHSWHSLLGVVGSVAANLMVGWLVALGPAILILTVVFRLILRKIPLGPMGIDPIANN
jgi:uncharacterized protein (DUF2062 family)